MMRKLIIAILIACLAVPLLTAPVRAEKATIDEALTVAKNWVALIIQNKGSWGGSGTAQVGHIQEFKRGDRVIGYFCHVKPQGYIVISLHKELAAVKAYSATSDLDPESEQGMADVIKGGMEGVLAAIEQKLGPIESAPSEDVQAILDINYRQAWEELEGDVGVLKKALGSGIAKGDYQEGEVLLSSHWHQGDPYNRQVPAPPSGDPCTAAHCAVGCVATAGAQIMRYWNWPPYGVGSPYNDAYDWPNMPNKLTGASPAAQIDAVAELCHEVGVAADMDYCDEPPPCASSAYHSDMVDAYEDHYRYSTDCGQVDRGGKTAVEWFNRMKEQFNANRPVQYGVPGHSLVGDGWQEIGAGPTRQYHMNYGWGFIGTDPHGNDTWYTLDALHLGDPGEEDMLENIYPAQALGASLMGYYQLDVFRYRYFDRDATADSATFEAGQALQFLPNITVGCTSYINASIRFLGSPSANTVLFTRGDKSQGIRIYNGGVKLMTNGDLSLLHIRRPDVVTFSGDPLLTSAFLRGRLDDLGTASSVWVSFEVGLDTSYGVETPATEMLTEGYFGTELLYLQRGTTYHFRAKAVGDGIDYGDDMSFTTL